MGARGQNEPGFIRGRDFCGRAWACSAYRDKMKPSPLIGRLSRMKNEVDHGKESAERKLRYLLWLN